MADSRFGRFWARLWSGVIADIPPSLEECESCREVDCTHERWLRCERRMVAEAASLADNPPAATNEFPQMTPAGMPAKLSAATPAPTEETSAQARSKKISVH